MESPSSRVKLFFWLILGSLSTYFAEVWSGSQIYSFYNSLSYILVIPLYTLHTLFLWTLIWRHGRPWLYALFPAGCLFGLYEAYITKVLWNPTWETAMPQVFGIALTETMVLVLFWHCFMSFIIPLLLAEAVFTGSSEIYSLLPGWARRVISVIETRKLYYLLPVLGGVFQSTGASTLLDTILSGILTTLFLVVLLVLWRRKVGTEYSMRAFLPGERQFKAIGASLLAYYLVTGFLLRPAEIPDLGSQATIWVLYVFFVVQLILGIRKSNVIEASSSALSLNPSPHMLMLLGGLLSAGSVLGFITGLNYVWALLVWLIGILFGLYVLIQTLRNVTSVSAV
jgi:hypothetical protein